jgi:hypothetical protein
MSNPNDAKRERRRSQRSSASEKAAGSGWGEPPDAFLAAYYRHVPAEDILTRTITVPTVDVNTRPESSHAGPSARASAA